MDFQDSSWNISTSSLFIPAASIFEIPCGKSQTQSQTEIKHTLATALCVGKNSNKKISRNNSGRTSITERRNSLPSTYKQWLDNPLQVFALMRSPSISPLCVFANLDTHVHLDWLMSTLCCDLCIQLCMNSLRCFICCFFFFSYILFCCCRSFTTNSVE